MELIKDTVKNIIRRIEAREKNLSDGNPEKILKKILSKEEYKHVKLNYFAKGVLSISADSSAWLYILSLQKEELLKKFSKQLPTIKRLCLYIGDRQSEKRKNKGRQG